MKTSVPGNFQVIIQRTVFISCAQISAIDLTNCLPTKYVYSTFHPDILCQAAFPRNLLFWAGNRKKAPPVVPFQVKAVDHLKCANQSFSRNPIMITVSKCFNLHQFFLNSKYELVLTIFLLQLQSINDVV